MSYKENPKMVGSGMLACIPQTGRCPNNCEDCFFQSGMGGKEKRGPPSVCPDCGGRGRMPVRLPGGRRTELSCLTCHGSGKASRGGLRRTRSREK